MDFSQAQPAAALLERIMTMPQARGAASAEPSWLQLFPPRAIEWNRLELPLSSLPGGLRGFRIVHLTDFHLRRRWPQALDLVLERINNKMPDLVLMTGDFVDNKRNYRPGLPQVRRLLESVRARFGVFAIHGNHDSYKIGQELADLPVSFMDGRRQLVQTPGGNLEIIGLPGKHRIELTPEVLASFPPRHTAVPRIVLSHFPDHLKRTRSLSPDLFLAGHTHGGQVCLPNGTPLLRHDALPRHLAKGAHRVGGTWIVVGRGLGYTGLPIRANCPPEVIEISLTSDATAAAK